MTSSYVVGIYANVNFNRLVLVSKMLSCEGRSCLCRFLIIDAMRSLPFIIRHFAYSEGAGEENEVPKTISHVHKDDILCIDMYNSSIVATASYDGQIAVWNLETGRIFYRFDVNNLREFKLYQGIFYVHVLVCALLCCLRGGVKIANTNESQLMSNREENSS